MAKSQFHALSTTMRCGPVPLANGGVLIDALRRAGDLTPKQQLRAGTRVAPG
jgi:hypothetical protein